MSVTERDRETAAHIAANWSQNFGADELFPLQSMIATFLADERARAVAPFLALAEEWRYKGEYGWGPWQAGEGPDIEGQVLDDAALRIRRAAQDAGS